MHRHNSNPICDHKLLALPVYHSDGTQFWLMWCPGSEVCISDRGHNWVACDSWIHAYWLVGIRCCCSLIIVEQGAMNIIGTAYPTVGTMNAALRSHSKT
jgi:hypothetical protein